MTIGDGKSLGEWTFTIVKCFGDQSHHRAIGDGTLTYVKELY
jgi:hypothetical protein